MNHSFDTEDAKQYGVPQAIILQNFRHWTEYNRANGTNIHDGRVWTFNSIKAFAEIFPYFTADQIRRYVESLEAAGAIVVGNFNKRGGDRTKWYSLAGDEGLAIRQDSQSNWQNRQMEKANPPDGNGENATPLPDLNSDLKPDIKHTPAPDNNPIPIEARREKLNTGFLPEPLVEPFRLFCKHVFDTNLSKLDYDLRIAISKTSIEIVRDAVLEVVATARKQAPSKDYLPSLSSLLKSEDNLRRRATLYRPYTPTPTYENRELTIEGVKAFESMLAELTA